MKILDFWIFGLTETRVDKTCTGSGSLRSRYGRDGVIRFVEKYFTCVKDPKNSGQSLVAALQSRPPLTLTINTIRDYVSLYT